MPSRTQKFRGNSRTHGRGKKSGRGKGKRGGCGNAGMHKHKYIWMLKNDPLHFGRHGFVRHHAAGPEGEAMNVGALCEYIDSLIAKGTVKETGEAISIDLSAIGVSKLIGSGLVDRAINVKVSAASEHAVSKIKEAGGSVAMDNPPEEKPSTKPAAPKPAAPAQAPAKPAQAPHGKPAAPRPAAPAQAPQPKPATPKPATPAKEKPEKKGEK
ncbi:MAG: uL15 family ribosomal protein [Euryarchaeota archaeon]|nr:uL15 family ribosomal protein [Euryarchaeota archaeon]